MNDEQPAFVPSGEQLARWLRALAQAVEHDPELAARVTNPSPAATIAPIGIPNSAAVTTAQAEQQLSPVVPVTEALPVAKTPSSPAEALATPVPPPAPAIAHQRQATKYGEPAVAGRSGTLGAGVPDPFVVFSQGGEPALVQALATVRTGTLRAIIRAHTLDAAGKLTEKTTDAKLRSFIVAAVRKAVQPPLPLPATRRRYGKKSPQPLN